MASEERGIVVVRGVDEVATLVYDVPIEVVKWVQAVLDEVGETAVYLAVGNPKSEDGLIAKLMS